ncbi:hypothetical protein RBU49_15485 [Clostridium sp. MB40-C1]|uniref:hypothetical protein n=1 Tax=Clostridium sp. MB40-C1 TaxID=3070996 RepID=UPI0027DECC37|nr:hypothetical protein [Clostridium sp. MB40-C1]WMJ80206.1 hypothetical protein RBU49_15485 [Clostridium sp. MB40-C1]
MHDSFLMQNISKGINEVCRKNNLKKVTLIDISVGFSSHITEKNLLEHLVDLNSEVVDENTQVKVNYEDMPELMAVIKKVEGEKR